MYNTRSKEKKKIINKLKEKLFEIIDVVQKSIHVDEEFDQSKFDNLFKIHFINLSKSLTIATIVDFLYLTLNVNDLCNEEETKTNNKFKELFEMIDKEEKDCEFKI